MYQPSTNFIGKDPMQWWIGQVTDPDKGEWGDLLEKKRAEDGEQIYSHRCRVRIVGYHGCADDLPDKDLPLAHVLLPPNTATTGGCGETMQYQGGEVVVGFFFDGEDAQQPVIFGTLFKQSFIEDKLTKSQFDAKKQTCFIPYMPPKIRENLGKNQVVVNAATDEEKKEVASTAYTDNEGGGKDVAHNQKEEATDKTIDNSTACQDNEISRMTNTMKEFTKKLKTLQKLNSANTFVNPVYGGIVDIHSELKLTSNKLQNSMTKLVRRGRSWVINETLDKLGTTFKDKVPKTLQPQAGKAAKDLTDVIFCNFEKIQDELLDYLNKSLENMIGQILDVPICGIENFLGDMFGQINNILDSQLGDMFNQLNAIQGGGILLPSETFTKALKYANFITNALECDAQNCPDNTTYSSKAGTQLSGEDDLSNVISNMGISSLLDPLLDKMDNAIAAEPSAPDCSTNVLRCGPPKVDIVGGGGNGASGSAIVNVLGQVIGVAINKPGSGYIGPPLLTFVDSCDNGYGAGGYVIIEDGQVSDVVITSPGQEYLPNTTETTLNADGSLTEREVIPDPNGNYDGEISYIATLEDVVVENTGFGYDDDDTLTVTGGDGEVEVELIIEDGRIVDTNVINGGFGFTSLPEVSINSDTGALARVTPVLKFTKVDDAAQLAQISQDAVVTVISCITK